MLLGLSKLVFFRFKDPHVVQGILQLITKSQRSVYAILIGYSLNRILLHCVLSVLPNSHAVVLTPYVIFCCVQRTKTKTNNRSVCEQGTDKRMAVKTVVSRLVFNLRRLDAFPNYGLAAVVINVGNSRSYLRRFESSESCRL